MLNTSLVLSKNSLNLIHKVGNNQNVTISHDAPEASLSEELQNFFLAYDASDNWEKKYKTL